MVTFHTNRRSGLTVDRDSLHASDGYKRQIEALRQLQQDKPMSTEELRKAVELFESLPIDHEPDGWPAVRMRDITLVVRALRDLEAENARLREAVMKQEGDASSALLLAAMAESRLAAANALLRSIAAYCPPDHECQQGCPSDLCEACKLREYLQGAGDEA